MFYQSSCIRTARSIFHTLFLYQFHANACDANGADPALCSRDISESLNINREQVEIRDFAAGEYQKVLSTCMTTLTDASPHLGSVIATFVFIPDALDKSTSPAQMRDKFMNQAKDSNSALYRGALTRTVNQKKTIALIRKVIVQEVQREAKKVAHMPIW